MKLFGLVFISLVPALMGFWKGENIKQKRNQALAFLLFLKEVDFQIRHFNREQKEIYASFQNPALTKSGFLPQLLEETNENPVGALDRTVRSHLPDFLLSQKMEDAILLFSRNFGTQSKERQLMETQNTIEILQKELQGEEKKVKDKIKMMRVTGICAGLWILILLL